MPTLRFLKTRRVKGAPEERRLRRFIHECKAEILGDKALLYKKRKRRSGKLQRERQKRFAPLT